MPNASSPIDYRALIAGECLALSAFLLQKNDAYGNSAFEPKRLVAKADAVTQIEVRIDDKLSRIFYGREFAGDDTLLDLAGYIMLHRIAKRLRDGAGPSDVPPPTETTPSVVVRVPIEATPPKSPADPKDVLGTRLARELVNMRPAAPSMMGAPVPLQTLDLTLPKPARSLVIDIKPENGHGAADGFGGSDFDVERFVTDSSDEIAMLDDENERHHSYPNARDE